MFSSRPTRWPAEDVPLAQASGRTLAEDALAVIDLPRFPSSAMDGFALRAADTPGALPVVARVAAGRPAPRPLRSGEAMGIATGGVVPDGADAVVPIEHVTEQDGAVNVPVGVSSGANIRPLGADVRSGEPVLTTGSLLTPPRIAALAAAGVAEPRCSKLPRIAIVTTGTELRPPGEALADGEITSRTG